MTLIVAISRAAEYALTTTDSMVFKMYRDGRTVPWDDQRQPNKVTRLADRVLLSCGGSAPIGKRLRAQLRAACTPADDLAACQQAAQRVVDDLWQSDARDHIRSIKDAQHFSFVMNGFLADGTTGTVVYESGQPLVGDVDQVPEFTQVVIGNPYGTTQDDYWDALLYSHAVELEQQLTLQASWLRACAVHRALGTKYDDRVTRDINLTVLLPARDEFALLTAAVDDWADDAKIASVYHQLAALRENACKNSDPRARPAGRVT